MACIEQHERAVVTPCEGVRVHVREKTDRPWHAAIDWHERDVRERFRSDDKRADPFSVRRPCRPRSVERIRKDRGRDKRVLMRVHVDHAQLLAIAEKREALAVEREDRRQIGRVACRERGFLAGREVVEIELCAVAARRHIHDPPAIWRPCRLRLQTRRHRQSRCVARVF